MYFYTPLGRSLVVVVAIFFIRKLLSQLHMNYGYLCVKFIWIWFLFQKYLCFSFCIEYIGLK